MSNKKMIYDKDGYDQKGFDKDGIHRDTKTKYNLEGYNRYGVNKYGFKKYSKTHVYTRMLRDKAGYNQAGFDREGIHRETGTKYDPEGFNEQGYDIEGYDKQGFHIDGHHKETGTEYDSKGIDRYGFQKDSRVNIKTRSNWDKAGFNKEGFNRAGIHRDTGTKYNPEGFTQQGRSEKFTSKGIHIETRTKYDPEGFDVRGNDREGYGRDGFHHITQFNREGINKVTKNKFNATGFDVNGFDRQGYNVFGYDREGYDKQGYNVFGYDREGYDKKGFNKDGYHKETGTKYDVEGFNIEGYDAESFDREGFSKSGIDRDGFNRKGFNRSGYDRNGFDKEGFDKFGQDKNGFNRKGFNAGGIHKHTGTKYDLEGFDSTGYNEQGFDKNGIDRQGFRSDTGKKDAKVQFAEEFIAFGKSLEQFAKEKQLPLKEVKSRIEEVRNFGCIKDAINKALDRNSNRLLGKVKSKKEQLLDGKIGIKDIDNIDIILRLCEEKERVAITEMFIKEIASHEISIMEYKTILGVKHIDGGLPQIIIEKLEKTSWIAKKSNNKDIRALLREIYKEMDRVKGYRAQYKPGDGERLGYMERPTDKQPKMVDITSEHREMAKQYLIATDEFICNKTMQATLMQIIKGNIDQEKLDRVKKEKKLRTLQNEDAELDEVIVMAEQVIERQQGQTQNSPSVKSLNLDDDNGEQNI